MPETKLSSLVQDARERIVDFGQRLLRTPSFSGKEKQIAGLVLNEMQTLGYDEAWVDEAGNVLGKLSGGPGRTTMLHAHMDIVDPGDVSRWSHPPFSGEIAEGYLWGRGSSDTKGCLMAQVYAVGLLREAGLRPAGDVYVAAVVGEEVGGFGSHYLINSFEPTIDVAIIGEPSSNTLRRGHRGRFEFIITMRGRSAHASAPQRGLNPHYPMARFLLALRETPMMRGPIFGGSSVAPTLGYVDQTSSNVIPAEATIHLDWRTTPAETLQNAQAILKRLFAETVEPGIQASVEVRSCPVRAYTGLEMTVRHELPSFCLQRDDPLLVSAEAILEQALGRPVDVGVWTFCTDGGILYAAGVPCIGFGPGEEAMAHVLDERLNIEQMLEATAGYMALALKMGDAEVRPTSPAPSSP